MAGTASRDMLIKKATTRLAGINSKSVAVDKSPIDVTTDEDNGFRTLMDVAGSKTLDISFSGVTKDSVLRGLIMTGSSQLLTDITLEYPPIGAQTAGDSISGDFYLANLTENGSSPDGSVEFDGTLQSSGEWTYTVGV